MIGASIGRPRWAMENISTQPDIRMRQSRGGFSLPLVGFITDEIHKNAQTKLPILDWLSNTVLVQNISIVHRPLYAFSINLTACTSRFALLIPSSHPIIEVEASHVLIVNNYTGWSNYTKSVTLLWRVTVSVVETSGTAAFDMK